jgi:hypothetical protein
MRVINFKKDLEKTLVTAQDTGKLPHVIPVEFVSAEAAKVYSKSSMSEVNSALHFLNIFLARISFL